MSKNGLNSWLVGSALLASTLVGGGAWAAGGAASATLTGSNGLAPIVGAPAIGPRPTSTMTATIDVSGIFSYDAYGAAINTITSTMLSSNAHVVGIGWDVELMAESPSWLSELKVSFESSSASFIFLTPGVGDNMAGTASYSSGGVINLVDLGLDFNVDADGLLVSQFHEGFDDFAGDWDGQWLSGTITVEYIGAVPEPETYGMMALGLGVVGAIARRRRQTLQ